MSKDVKMNVKKGNKLKEKTQKRLITLIYRVLDIQIKMINFKILNLAKFNKIIIV